MVDIGNDTKTDVNHKEEADTSPNKLIPINLVSFVQSTNHRQLNELFYYYSSYKGEIQASINNNKPIQSHSFKNALFTSLEATLFQLAHIKSKNELKKRIGVVHRWFNDKVKGYKNNSSVTKRTYLAPGENYDKEIRLANEVKVEDNPLLHRSEDLLIENLKEYIVRQVDTNRNAFSNEKKEKEIKEEEQYEDKGEGEGEGEGEGDDNDDNDKGKKPKAFTIDNPQKRLGRKIINNNSELCKTRGFAQSTFLTGAPIIGHSKSTIDINPLKQVKSSYTFPRSFLNYNFSKLENDIAKSKNKELSHKRTQEVILDAIKDYGTNRAKFRQYMIQRKELTNIVTHYHENHHKKPKRSKDNISKLKSLKSTNRNRRLSSNLTKSPSEISYEETINSSKLNQNQLKEQRAFQQMQKHPNTRNHHKSRSQSVDPFDMSTKMYNKVRLNKIQNIDYRHHLTKSITNETECDFFTTQHPMMETSFHQTNINHQSKNGSLSTEAIALGGSFNEILNARLNGRVICDVKEVDSEKEDIRKYWKPLSSFDKTWESLNLNGDTRKKDKKKQWPIKLCTSGIEFVKRNYEEGKGLNNLLKLRQTISEHNINEVKSLRKRIAFNKSTIDRYALNNAFNKPKNFEVYPLCYLPRNGSGLLSLPMFNNIPSSKKA